MVDYEKFKLKSYSSWDLFLHANQFPFIGRGYAWARSPQARSVVDMSVNERNELFDEVVPDWEKAVSGLWRPDTTNLTFFGNTTQHLHAHLIPRYNSPRFFEGIEFKDPNPVGNYSPYPKKTLDELTLFKIRDLLSTSLW